MNILNSNTRTKFAKIIRIITVPYFIALILYLFLRFGKNNFFGNDVNFILIILFLVIIPSIAYPIVFFIPKLHALGRKVERKLAFISTFIGYISGLLYQIFSNSPNNIFLIYFSYLLSFIILLLINILKYKASGHACGVGGPLVLFVYYFGYWYIIPCVLISVGVFWSSIYLKRHTLLQCLLGFSVSIISLLFSLLICNNIN